VTESAAAANMRIDEIEQLRDAGLGKVVGCGRDPERPGLYSVRYTLSDGKTVDIDTTCPPCTRHQREAMFAEVRQLKKAFRFSVSQPVRKRESVFGYLRYNLSNGRTLELYDRLPREAISADGKYVVVPGRCGEGGDRDDSRSSRRDGSRIAQEFTPGKPNLA
jgi:hypothetical protein